MENVAVYRCIKEASGEKGCSQKGSDDIGSSLGMPIMLPKAALTFGSVPISSGHIMGKAAFVNIDNRFSTRLIIFYLCFKSFSGRSLRLRMLEGFFL